MDRLEPISSTLCRSLSDSSFFATCHGLSELGQSLGALRGGGRSAPLFGGSVVVACLHTGLARLGDSLRLTLRGAGMASLTTLLHSVSHNNDMVVCSMGGEAK